MSKLRHQEAKKKTISGFFTILDSRDVFIHGKKKNK